MLCTPDISKGHAACKIPAINLVDKENFVEDVKFIYTEVNVDEHGFVQREFGGCTCVDECVPGNCECIDKSSIKITDDCRIDLLNGNPGCYETILIECDKKTCNCHGKCGWKVTPDQFKLKVELFKTPQAGWAVRSRQCIEAGTYISEFVGEYCNAKRMENRPLDYAYNILQLNKSSNVYIDPYVYGNITRFFNHSCFENLQPFRFLSHHRDSKRISLGFYASRDIMPGDEMTIDYGIEWWTRQIQEAQRKDEHFYCYCDWVYCLNPAPGKPQMEKEDAYEEIKQRIAENSKTIMLLKKIEGRRKLGLTKNEEKGGKSKQKRKSKIRDDDDGDESSITDDEDSDEEEKEESNNGKENLE